MVRRPAYPNTEEVGGGAGVVLLVLGVGHLGSHEPDRADKPSPHTPLAVQLLSQTKVNQLHLELIVSPGILVAHHDVLWLQVEVDHLGEVMVL